MTIRKSLDNDHFNSSNKSELPFEKSTVIIQNYSNEMIHNKFDNGEVFEEKEKNSVAEANPDSKNYDCCSFEEAIIETGYGKYNLLLLLASLPGFFGCINTTSAISLILPSAKCDLNLSNFDKGLMNSVSYIGMISCAFLWGFLSDTFGRKKPLITAFVLDVILCSIVGLAQNFTIMVIAKLFSGFISAGPYAILMTYLAEYHSSKYRASVLVWTGMFSSLGTVCLPALAFLIIPQPINLHLWKGFVLPSWRIFFLVSTIPSLLVSVFLSFFDESPKFLMSCGRNEEAMKVFKTIYAMNTAKSKDTFPIRSLVNEIKENSNKMDVKNCGKFVIIWKSLMQIKSLFKKPYITNALLSFVVQFGTLSSLHTMRLWIPELFSVVFNKEKNFFQDFEPTTLCQVINLNLSKIEVNDTQITELTECVEYTVDPKIFVYLVIIGIVTCIGFLGSGYLIRIIGNKLLIIFMNIIGGFCSIGMYWSASSNIMLVLTSIFITTMSISATTIISTIVNLFPTNLRAITVSLTLMFGRCGAIIGNLTFPLLLDWDCIIVFFFISGIVFGSGIICLLLPKTKGTALK